VRLTKAAIGAFAVIWIAAMLSCAYAASENSENFLPLANIITSICPWGFGDKGQPGVPGPLEISNTDAVPIVSGDDDTSPTCAIVGVASQSENGRVVGIGHDGFFINGALSLYDNKQFGINIINWLEGTQNKKKILVTTGHGEPWVGSGDYDDFYAELRNKGYTVNIFSGTITSSSLSDVGILFISCPGPTLSAAEIDSIKSFVSNGGGLFLQGLGWSWISYEKRSLDEYPLNKLATAYGFKWIGGYISDPTNNRNGCPVFHTFFLYEAGNVDKIETPGNSHVIRSEDLPFSNTSRRMDYINFTVEKTFSYPPAVSGDRSTSNSNLPPTVESLTTNPASPQEVGATVTWTATASDPENDLIYYKFLLKGPKTGGEWQVEQDWSTNNAWTWNVVDSDVGSSAVSVRIRDGKHAGAEDMDDFKESSGYTVNKKQLPPPNVQVATDIYAPGDQRVHYCDEGGKYAVRNRLYLTGPDLNRVASVKYILPPSFPKNEVVSSDPSNNFEIWISTWGRFEQVAFVTTKDGQVSQINYFLTFKDKVLDAQSRGVPFVKDCSG